MKKKFSKDLDIPIVARYGPALAAILRGDREEAVRAARDADDEIADAKARKLLALAAHYGIDTRRFETGWLLALKLAEEFVPGFKPWTRRGVRSWPA